MALIDTAVRPHHPPIHRRAVASLVAFVLATLALTLLAALFVWPVSEVRRIDVGGAESFAPGSVTSFRLIDDAPHPLNPLTQRARTREAGFHIVHLEDGELIALDWQSPHLGYAAQWEPERQWDAITGFFNDDFSLWFMDGRRAFGPTPRDLARYRVEVTEDSRVIVDLGQRVEGEWRVERTSGAVPPQVTPTPAATVPPAR